MPSDKFNLFLGFFLFVCFIAVGWGLYSYFSIPQKGEIFSHGKTDTLIIKGKSDTIFTPQFINKYITVKEVINFGKDSSQSDTLISFGPDTLRLKVTTFPSVDSLHYNISLISTLKEILRVDTLIFSRIDTISTIKYLSESSPFYADSWFYVSLISFASLIILCLGSK